MSETGELVKRLYGAFRGADFRGDDVNIARSPDCLNVWKDYKGLGGICTRPAMRLFNSFTSPIYGIFFFKGRYVRSQ